MAMMDNFSESDEAFARRLQAQEMGNFTQHGHADAQTPLVNRQNENPTVINARYNEVQSSRAALYLLFIVYGPQILASLIVLSIHWDDANVCDPGHTWRWKWWAMLSTFRMAAFTGVVYFMDTYRVWLQEHREYTERLKNFRNALEAFGLVWFVVGNIWLFGDDSDICHHPQRSPIYNLCVSLLVLNYIHICFPCIIAIVLIPVFCFCMPCLIRMLARLQDPRASVGASEAVLETLPEVIVDSTHIRLGQDNTCPICLSEMAIGESARVLRCSHIFHKQCVDEWLRVNASCPTCRKRIFDVGAPGTTQPAGDAAAGNVVAAGSGRAGAGAVVATGTGVMSTTTMMGSGNSGARAAPVELAMYTFPGSGGGGGRAGAGSYTLIPSSGAEGGDGDREGAHHNRDGSSSRV